MLGIPHLCVAVNKMDLKEYARPVFDEICADFGAFAQELGFKDVTYIPISALKGDNVVHPSTNTAWYQGPTVLGYLEAVPIASDRNLTSFRFPVQYVLRPTLDYRGFAGQVGSGVVKPGDSVMVLPSGKTTKVKAIDLFGKELPEAFAPMSVTLRLAEEVDVSRGDVLVHPHDRPTVSRHVEADLVWLHETPLDTQKTYWIKHTTQFVRGQVERVDSRLNLGTLAHEPASGLQLNEIGRVQVTCHRALYFDDYRRNRETGAFIVVDSLTNVTVGAGMIRRADVTQDLEQALREIRAGSAIAPKTQVSPRERRERFGQTGATVWQTGLPGSGRWSLAYALERRLFDQGRTAHVADPTGETLETMIAVARACTEAGLITICAFESKSRAERSRAAARIGAQRFVEIYVDTPLEVCRERRPDADFEGFEPPDHPAATVKLPRMLLELAVDGVLAALERAGI
jgi:bifunctional enzyme CysN/CysC